MATKPKTEAHDFPSHITLEDAMKLSVGDPIDHRDNGGFFAIATVFEKHESKLKIHYDGYSKKYDKWCDVANVDFALPRFAPAGSISQRSSHQDHFRSLKVGDHVDFNPYTRPGQVGWKVGKIIQLGKKRDQVMVEYTFRNVRNTYWTHLDNEKEIAQYKTKQSHSHSTEWEPIDVIKALLWDSDGRSVQWIALKMGRSSADVRKQIIEKKRKEGSGRTGVQLDNKYLESVQKAERNIKRRLPIGSKTSVSKLVRELARRQLTEAVVNGALHIMHSRGEIEYRARWRQIYRLK